MSDIRENCDLYEIIRIVNESEWKERGSLSDLKKYLNNQMELRIIKPGESISYQNIAGEYVHYVIKGEYYHYRNSKEGKRNVVALYTGPEWIGIDRALDMENSNITYESVIKKCIVIDIKAKYFVHCLNSDGKLALHIIKNLLGKMSSTSARVDFILFNDARTKTLLWFNEYWNSNYAGGECVIALKNENIADAIGISTRTLYRVLGELKKEGMVSIRKGNIVINTAQIEKMVDSISK